MEEVDKYNGKINYSSFKLQILRYLYDNRDIHDTDKRTLSRLHAHFNVTKSTIAQGIYELKGMKLVDIIVVGTAKICVLTEEGLSYSEIKFRKHKKI